jgi:hypothetical protein
VIWCIIQSLLLFPVSREFLYIAVLKILWFSKFPYNRRFFHLSSHKTTEKDCRPFSAKYSTTTFFTFQTQLCLVMHKKKSPISLPFAVLFTLYPSVFEGNLATQFDTVSSLTYQIHHRLHSTQCGAAFWNFLTSFNVNVYPLFLATYFAYSCFIGPCIYKFLALTLADHTHIVSLYPAFQFFIVFVWLGHCYNFAIDFIFLAWLLIFHTLTFSQH